MSIAIVCLKGTGSAPTERPFLSRVQKSKSVFMKRFGRNHKPPTPHGLRYFRQDKTRTRRVLGVPEARRPF